MFADGGAVTGCFAVLGGLRIVMYLSMPFLFTRSRSHPARADAASPSAITEHERELARTVTPETQVPHDLVLVRGANAASDGEV